MSFIIVSLSFFSITLFYFFLNRSKNSFLSQDHLAEPDLSSSLLPVALSALSLVKRQGLQLMLEQNGWLLIQAMSFLMMQSARGQGTPIPNINNGTNVSALVLQTSLQGVYGYTIFLTRQSEFAYVQDWGTASSPIYIIMIENPFNPVQLSSQAPANLRGSSTSRMIKLFGENDNFLLMLDNDYFTLFDVSNPVMATQISKTVKPTRALEKTILSPNEESIIETYLRYPYTTITVLNASNTNQIISTLSTTYLLNDLIFSKNGTWLYVAQQTNVLVINASNITGYKITNTIIYNGAYKLALADDRFLLVTFEGNPIDRGYGFDIFDVANSAVRKKTNSFNAYFAITQIKVTSNGFYAYFIGNKFLVCVDLRDPLNLNVISNTTVGTTASFPNDFALDETNGFIYVVSNSGNSGLQVFRDPLLTQVITPAPSTLAPITPSPATPQPPTSTPPTNAPAVQTPAPITLIPTPEPPAITLPPQISNAPNTPLPSGQTASPDNYQLGFNIPSNSTKVVVTGVDPVRTITLYIQVASNIAVYMSGTAGLGSEYDSRSGTLQIIAANENDLNARLSAIRFSPNSALNNYNHTPVSLVVSQGSNNNAWGTAILSNFGTNSAPLLINNATLVLAETNQTVSLFSPFSVDLNAIVLDANNDPLRAIVTAVNITAINTALSLPLNAQVLNNVVAAICASPGTFIYFAVMTDEYLKTQPIQISITCRYIHLFIQKIIQNINVKAGDSFSKIIFLNSIFAGGAAPFTDTMAFSNGLLLSSKGLSFDGQTLSGLIQQDFTGNISVTRRDLFGYTLQTLFQITAFDYQPVVVRNISNVMVNALQSVAIDLSNTITDVDDIHLVSTVTQSNGASVIPIGGEFDANALRFVLTPLISMLNQLFSFIFKRCDPLQKCAQLNFTIQVLPHYAPIINIVLQNLTGIVGSQITINIPDNAFNSSYPLILSAEELLSDPTQKLDQYQFASNSLTVTFQKAGNYIFRFNATDPLGYYVSQLVYIKINDTIANKLLFYIGIALAATGVTAVGQYFNLFRGILNAWLQIFRYQRRPLNESYMHKVNVNLNTIVTIEYFMRKNSGGPDSCGVALFGRLYLYDWISTIRTDEPRGVFFDNKTKCFSIDQRELASGLPDKAELLIRVYNRFGILKEAFSIYSKSIAASVYKNRNKIQLDERLLELDENVENENEDEDVEDDTCHQSTQYSPPRSPVNTKPSNRATFFQSEEMMGGFNEEDDPILQRIKANSPSQSSRNSPVRPRKN